MQDRIAHACANDVILEQPGRPEWNREIRTVVIISIDIVLMTLTLIMHVDLAYAYLQLK